MGLRRLEEEEKKNLAEPRVEEKYRSIEVLLIGEDPAWI